MKLVYIISPFWAPSDRRVDDNVCQAELAMLDVARLRLTPVCPHSMYVRLLESFSQDVIQEAALRLLERCDAALLLPGWMADEYAVAQVAECRRMFIPVIDSMEDLARWAMATIPRCGGVR